jgi:hypothetical protein
MPAKINPPTVADIVYIDTNLTPFLAYEVIEEVSSTGNLITLTGDPLYSTDDFIVDQTIVFTGTPIGNIKTDGTVYWIKTIDTTKTFTISETYQGPVFDPGNGTGSMFASVGGTPTVRVTTGTNHNLSTNDVVRLDGIKGSIKLNNNTYYVHVITDKIVDLYDIPYSNILGNTNMPVTGVTEYQSGGYIWTDKQFTLVTNNIVETFATSNQLVVADYQTTVLLVPDTPIIFTGQVFGGIVAGTTYYINEVIDNHSFTISATYQGPTFALTPSSGKMNVTQWEQVNVDRVWVTINGKRVPSSSLRFNEYNNLSILSIVTLDDTVMITSMMPSATPNEEVYLQNVNKNNVQTIFRANARTRTWLTQDLNIDDQDIYLDDITKVTDKLIQTDIAPAAVDDVISIPVLAEKRAITGIVVYNNTTAMVIDSDTYRLVNVDLAPTLEFDAITSGVSEFDNLTITVTEGNLLYINGEQIIFTSVNETNNTVSGLRRGINGTGMQKVIPANTEVIGLLPNNLLPSAYYTDTWNSYVYNTVLGDPLQISLTEAAIFLKGDFT